uniref:Uncharacterized protein n=1 Tax=Parastrongyloides trichosuri TaxID=131310 RepID=A0A0N4ZDP9_PARTI
MTNIFLSFTFFVLSIYFVNGCLRSRYHTFPTARTTTVVTRTTTVVRRTTTVVRRTTTPIGKTTITNSLLTTTTTSTTTSTTTIAPFCGNRDNRARVYIDPSATATGVTNPIFGSKTGTSCALCSNTKYYTSATSDVFDGSDTSGAINTFQCPENQKLCLCDQNYECFEENDATVATTLYPYCTSPTNCYVYSILSAQTDTEGVVAANGVTKWTPAGTTNPNFSYKSVTSGVFEKVSAISCNGCPVLLAKKSCLPDEPTF